MNIHPADETSYTTQYQETFRKQVENEYCAQHQGVAVNKLNSLLGSKLIPLAMASGSFQ
jgi:hypothetical protein